MYVAFIDLQKVFDFIPGKIRLNNIKSLKQNNAKAGNSKSEMFEKTEGLGQGVVLSSLLFNVALEETTKDINSEE